MSGGHVPDRELSGFFGTKGLPPDDVLKRWYEDAKKVADDMFAQKYITKESYDAFLNHHYRTKYGEDCLQALMAIICA